MGGGEPGVSQPVEGEDWRAGRVDQQIVSTLQGTGTVSGGAGHSHRSNRL
jgi:hypothetical protein